MRLYSHKTYLTWTERDWGRRGQGAGEASQGAGAGPGGRAEWGARPPPGALASLGGGVAPRHEELHLTGAGTLRLTRGWNGKS